MYSNLIVEEDELRIKRFLPLKVIEITLPMQLMTSAWYIFECLK
jgi:hypothetical protein